MRRRALPLLVLLSLATTARADESRLPKAALEKLLAETDAIAKTVSKLRALPIKREIPRGIMSKEEITARLIQRLDEDYSAAEIATEARALKRLGLMPADMDYRQTVLDVLTEQVAGFYDPHVRELYIADWIDAGMQRIVLAHEICHALQDQSFDLKRFIQPNRENGDEQLARQALVEGDGVALMIEFLFHEQGMKMDPWANDAVVNAVGAASGLAGGKLLDQAPLFLREMLLFPYRDGLRFIGASRKTRPWSDIDRMYPRPPISTEQILHPAKYRAGEKPAALRITPLPSLKDHKRLYFNVIGELMWSVFLRQHGIERARADTAAAGWGGDRVMLFATAEEPETIDDIIVVSFSTWDAEIDAVELHEAAAEALLALSRAESHAEKTRTFASAADGAGKHSFVERRGREVLLVVGASPDLAPKIRGEAWAKWGRAK